MSVYYRMNNIRHSPSEPSLAKAGTSTQSRFRKGSLNTQSDTPLSARQAVPGSGVNTVTPVSRLVSRPVLPVRPSPAPSPAYYTPPQSISKLEPASEPLSDRLDGINIEDFLPVRLLQSGTGDALDSGTFFLFRPIAVP